MDINKRIETLLLAKNGGNRSELARFCGVSPQAVKQWIDGTTAPRGKRLSNIADYFGISERDLMYGAPATSPRRTASGKSSEEMLAAFNRLNQSQKKSIVTMLEAYGAL